MLLWGRETRIMETPSNKKGSYCCCYYYVVVVVVAKNSIGTSDFDVVAVGEIIGGVGHVFQTLMKAEQVPAELIGHPFDALFTIRLAFNAGIFRAALVIHQPRLGVAVAVTGPRAG